MWSKSRTTYSLAHVLNAGEKVGFRRLIRLVPPVQGQDAARHVMVKDITAAEGRVAFAMIGARRYRYFLNWRKLRVAEMWSAAPSGCG